MQVMEKVEAAEKAWDKAPLHVKTMAGAYIQPVLEALRALATSNCPTLDGEKVMPGGCKAMNCSNGKSSTCTGHGCVGQSCAGLCTESAASTSKTGGSSVRCQRVTGPNGELCGLIGPCPDCGSSLIDFPAGG